VPTIAFARAEQLRCAAEIESNGWDERQAVLGLGDWFAEEFLMEMENDSKRKALEAAERALLELVPSHRAPGCWCAFGFDNRLRHSHRCRRAAEALAAVQAELRGAGGKPCE
jgi:hypothetical protein